MAEFAGYKMRRKFFSITLLFGIAFTSWTYWKYKARFYETLIIPRRKLYKIKNVSLQPFPTTCKSHPFLIILVTSYVGHVQLRNAHRRDYTAEDLRKINASRVFLLAQIPDKDKNVTQSTINDESKTFGDILQGTFIENFRNLTHKHLMGLKWASKTCQKPSFILKVDDDTVYNLERSYAFLKSVENSSTLLMGYTNTISEPARNKENKWYVSWDEYPRQKYPTFL